ncbi:MAG: hypothetical protein UU89_C0017G0036 [Parcubacteria group bacterium GW2011_GWC2_42_11]|nr:MAG: hypothetical protein UU89_C0017G0036 [Parcubacteria group bacterium GW2011_GWC2_42_11]
MNFREEVFRAQNDEHDSAPNREERNEFSEEQQEIIEMYQQELRDLETWRNELLQKCEANERDGKDCNALRQVIEDEYFEKELELRQRAHYAEHSV